MAEKDKKKWKKIETLAKTNAEIKVEHFPFTQTIKIYFRIYYFIQILIFCFAT